GQILIDDEAADTDARTDVHAGPSEPRRGLRGAERWAVVASALTSIVFIARSAFTIDGKLTFTLFDDAMISLTYARNFARGDGLVWNQGGERVEGYTNFLWTLWMAAIHAVGIPTQFTSLAVMVTGALLLAGTVVLTARITRHVSQRPVAAGVAAWMVALSPPLIYWTLRGMEVGLLAALLAGAVLLVVQLPQGASRARLFGLAALLVAGVLTRTDFAILALVLAAFATAWCRPTDRRRVVVATFGAAGATLVAHTAFRIAYYGAAVPNTYTLKLGGIPMVDRLDRGFTVLGDVVGIELLLPLLVVALGFLLDRRAPTAVEQLAGTLLLASFAYVAYTGGDAWEWMTMPNRYIAPVLPELAVLVGLATVKIAHARRPAGSTQLAVALVALLLLLLAVVAPSDDHGRQLASGKFLLGAAVAALIGLVALGIVLFASSSSRPLRAGVLGGIVVLALFAMPAYQWWRINASYLDGDQRNARVGTQIAETTSPHTQIAVVSAGGIVYFADRPAVDLLGKSDVTVANSAPHLANFVPGHVKWDYAWSLGKLQPDLVMGTYGDPEAAEADLRRYGYERVLRSVYVRSSSHDVDVAALRRALEQSPADITPATSR
ncbi:MAG TPA: hypothetical protein VFZ17_10700, partial [Acidimicrobiia bacterium]|nr:hypothetical protein [Acidimicrobiia bacterium]